jgi:hypothetical protein
VKCSKKQAKIKQTDRSRGQLSCISSQKVFKTGFHVMSFEMIGNNLNNDFDSPYLGIGIIEENTFNFLNGNLYKRAGEIYMLGNSGTFFNYKTSDNFHEKYPYNSFDIISIVLDMDNQTVGFYKNGNEMIIFKNIKSKSFVLIGAIKNEGSISFTDKFRNELSILKPKFLPKEFRNNLLPFIYKPIQIFDNEKIFHGSSISFSINYSHEEIRLLENYKRRFVVGKRRI